jgi:hypothetical protein
VSREPYSDDGHLRPTPFSVLAMWGVVGMIGGWALRPLSQRYADSPPVVGWPQVGAIVFVAAFLAASAWVVRRTVSRRRHLDPQRAVNLLVMAKACAMVGAVVAGGYAGYAIGWIAQPAHLAEQRMVRSAVAAVAGIAMCATALLLERACRVPDDTRDA